MEIKEKIDKVDEYLVGLWRFREPNKKPIWCATFVFNGFYYDVLGNKDILVTLDQVYKKVQRLKKVKKRK